MKPSSRTRPGSSATATAIAIALTLALSSCAALAPASPQPAQRVAADQLTRDDGLIPDGQHASPFDEDLPAVANLEPALREAIRAAASDAAADGFEMWVTSGWRSARYQQQLLDEAVVNYGSLAEALKWVDTPERSTHVTGRGVDIGPTDADSWLRQHGNDYGLCQTFANEMWHFELTVAPGEMCPAPAYDATDR